MKAQPGSIIDDDDEEEGVVGVYAVPAEQRVAVEFSITIERRERGIPIERRERGRI